MILIYDCVVEQHFSHAVTALSVILPSVKVFVSWCILRDAHSLYSVRGRIYGQEALPKAGFWQSQTPSIREFTCAGNCGNRGKHHGQRAKPL